MEKKRSQHLTSILQADLISILALVAFVVIVYMLDELLQPLLSGFTLILAGVILAIVPAIVWLAFFYRRDRLEPEPKGMVMQVFLLGALVAAAIGIPVVDNLFAVDNWLTRSTMTHILGAIFVIGFTQEFLKYAAVRFSVFGSSEFDEPVDGIVYATAAGLGYAALLNINFVIESGGVDLGAGVIRITVTSLAHASFAGVVGYFLGQEKFTKRPAWWSAAGVSLAAVLNGLFFFLRSTLTQGSLTASGGEVQRWLGFVLAAFLAAAVTWVLSGTIRKQMKLPAQTAGGMEEG
ncbi:MAG TPA: PrsW family glutamic-type intramembrane protease [Anaerolineales bacterium]|nr:PrsW family glutamic-type intramembrane protease [Anaerolineales bacterium]